MTVWWCLTLGRPYSCDGFGSAIHGANTQAPDRPARPSMAGRSPSREPVVRKRDGSPLVAPELQPLDVMPLQHQEQRQRSEEHTSELQLLMRRSYAVFCLTEHIHLTTFLYPFMHLFVMTGLK